MADAEPSLGHGGDNAASVAHRDVDGPDHRMAFGHERVKIINESKKLYFWSGGNGAQDPGGRLSPAGDKQSKLLPAPKLPQTRIKPFDQEEEGGFGSQRVQAPAKHERRRSRGWRGQSGLRSEHGPRVGLVDGSDAELCHELDRGGG